MRPLIRYAHAQVERERAEDERLCQICVAANLDTAFFCGRTSVELLFYSRPHAFGYVFFAMHIECALILTLTQFRRSSSLCHVCGCLVCLSHMQGANQATHSTLLVHGQHTVQSAYGYRRKRQPSGHTRVQCSPKMDLNLHHDNVILFPRDGD
jgi:hypothetical protein